MARVRFTIDAPNARKVLLAGDFTDWEAAARPMRRRKAGAATFSTSVTLPPGTYEYKFLVDGNWVEDPKAEQVANPFGTNNSLVVVKR